MVIALMRLIRSRSVRLSLALSLVGVMEPAAAAAPSGAAAPPATQPSAARPTSGEVLRIEVDPGFDDAELLPSWIREATADELEALPADARASGWIELQVGGMTYRYELRVTAMRGGTPVETRGELIRCDCTTEQFLVRVEQEVAKAVEELAEPVAAPGDEGGGSDGGPTEPVPPGATTDDPPSRYRPTGIGIAGFSLLGLGAASVVGGVVMLVRSPTSLDEAEYLVRDTRPPGIGLTAAGAAVLAGGVALTVVDVLACRSKGRCGVGARRKHAHAVLTPWRGPGLGLAGRF